MDEKNEEKNTAERREERLMAYCFPAGQKRGRVALIGAVLMVLATLFCTGVVIYYIAGPMEGELHSDFTDTIYWANASYESGRLFDPDFTYAGLLPFSANIWFLPLIALFGVTMKTQVIGMIVFCLLFVASVYFLCRSFDWSLPWTCFSICALLMVFSFGKKLREILWGHVIYYSLALLLLFFGLGLLVRLQKIRWDEMAGAENRKKRWLGALAALLSGVFFALVATDGLQIVALSTLPALVAIGAELFFDGKKKLFDRANLPTWCMLVGVLVSTGVGYLILQKMLGGITAPYADAYSSLAPISYWKEHAQDLPRHYFFLMGEEVTNGLPLKEMKSLFHLLKMIVAVLLQVLPLILLCCYPKIRDRGTRLILWAHLTVEAITLFGYICGWLSSANWRMVPMVGTSVLASVATLRFLLERRSARPDTPYSACRRMGSVLCAMLVCAMLFSAKQVLDFPADYGRQNDLHKLTEKLEAEGLKQGYATFWYSQAITLLSDSKVKVAMIRTDNGKGVWSDFYQNSYKWYESHEDVDRYFVLLTTSKYISAIKNQEWSAYVKEQNPERIDVDERYIILVFRENPDILRFRTAS